MTFDQIKKLVDTKEDNTGVTDIKKSIKKDCNGSGQNASETIKKSVDYIKGQNTHFKVL